MGKIISLLTDEERAEFDSQIAEPDENGCRLWTGPKYADLRGWNDNEFGLGPQGVPAHRMVYFLGRGVQPPARLKHLCGNKLCCTLDHIVTKIPKAQ